MRIGFFFWPYDPALVRRMAAAADRYGFDMIGIADTPGNAMDPWVAATMTAAAVRRACVALCVTNLVSRHPAVSAAAIASLDRLAEGRTVLGIGAGHSGTRNLGMANAGVAELGEGVRYLKTLLASGEATLDGATARIPGSRRRPGSSSPAPGRAPCGWPARPPTGLSSITASRPRRLPPRPAW